MWVYSVPSHQSTRRFFTDFSIVAEDVFHYLDDISQIDSTDIQADPADDYATWNYDPTADSDDTEDEENEENRESDTKSEDDGGYYYGYGCVIVPTGPKILVAAAFIQKNRIDVRDGGRMTRLSVKNPMWLLSDAL